ncbi:MAG: class I SAM-dependent methyltransferase [Planctomycetota bacterium]|jgi:SAM-dependent methyltransferase|nr:class I SAM-dependent methyltransferase [Planctomycetota bacterium]MDP6938100.1 class I SAM-dependent methyltransferase [Planctomycetota bacterium]
MLTSLPIPLCLATWLLAPAIGQDAPQRSSVAEDPEALEAGRSHYLGRPVARTMHWSGAPWLLRETREKEENGVMLREWLACKPGQVVCDLGSGNGYHSLPLARAVAPDGEVLAVDLQPEMLTMLKVRAGDAGITNIRTIEGSIDDPHLQPASCDLVLMVDVYHELSHPVRVLDHVRRSLRPGGRLVLVEFRSEDPEVHIKTEHKMSQVQVLDEMARNGLRFQAGTGALPWQHVLAFERAPAEEGDTRGWLSLGAREVARGWWRALMGEEDRVLKAFFLKESDASVTVAWRKKGRANHEEPGGWANSLKDWKLIAGRVTSKYSGSVPGEGAADAAPGIHEGFARFSGPRGESIECLLALNDGGSWRVSEVHGLSAREDR